MVIKKETMQRNCSYVELIADGPQIPQYCVNYQFGQYFADVTWMLSSTLSRV